MPTKRVCTISKALTEFHLFTVLARLVSDARGKAAILDQLQAVTSHWNTQDSTMGMRKGHDVAPTARKFSRAASICRGAWMPRSSCT